MSNSYPSAATKSTRRLTAPRPVARATFALGSPKARSDQRVRPHSVVLVVVLAKVSRRRIMGSPSWLKLSIYGVLRESRQGTSDPARRTCRHTLQGMRIALCLVGARGQERLEGLLIEDRDAQLLGLGRLTPRVGTHHHKVGVLGDGR